MSRETEHEIYRMRLLLFPEGTMPLSGFSTARIDGLPPMRREASKGPGEAIMRFRDGFHFVHAHVNLHSDTPGKARIGKKLMDCHRLGFVGHSVSLSGFYCSRAP